LVLLLLLLLLLLLPLLLLLFVCDRQAHRTCCHRLRTAQGW